MDKINVGITGMIGFIGSHLRERLLREENVSVIIPFEDSFFEDDKKLKEYLAKCDVVVHLAAMNRGEPTEIYKVNIELVNKLISSMEQIKITPYVIFSSSTQCDLDNPYGHSKKEGTRLLSEWATRNNASFTATVIPNVFGDRCRPFYNSVVATFCHQLTHNEQPKIIVDSEMNLIYINELTDLMYETIKKPPKGVDIMRVKPTAKAKVTEILVLLEGFKKHYYEKRTVPNLKNSFERNLYNTFLTYMENSDYEQHPILHSDDRGLLFEIVKQESCGQIFYSTTKPGGIVRGNHYHTRKMEKFCVVQGEAIIRLRRIGTDKIIEYRVLGQNPSIVEMPIFHTHNIENVGENDLHTLFWTNELFDPNDSDTFFEEV